MIHDIKILPGYFEAWMTGRKRAELRNADRNYQVGDTVRMWEWNKKYTGRYIMSDVLHIYDANPILELSKTQTKKKFCILSLATRKVGKGNPPEA